MHELAVTQSLINSVIEECKKNDIKNLKKIVVDLGFFTSYVKDSVLFYFDLLKVNFEILTNVELDINEIKGKIKCKKCGKESIIDDPYFVFCKTCNSPEVEIIQGREFIIKDLIMEDD